MTLYFPDATPGVRRFIGYAHAQGYEPLPVGMKPGGGATTLVYKTDRTYFLVFQRNGGQKIPRSVTRRIISGKYTDPKREFRIKDLETAYKDGQESVKKEMQPGHMTPFVSKDFTDFTVCLDRSSFEGNTPLAFPAGTNDSGFTLPAGAVKELLISLYGEGRVHEVDFFGNVTRG